jgi:integrase
LKEIEFEKIIHGKRRTTEQKNIYNNIIAFENKANDVINKMTVFNFDLFAEMYNENENAYNTVAFEFKKYANRLREDGSLATALNYECAMKSLENYKKGFSFADVTVSFLKGYEKKMIIEGKSKTTISMYLRCLRTIYNRQKIDKSIYPFGKQSEDKYTLPTKPTVKKALTLDEISKIYNYKAVADSTLEMAKDYWVFLYLSNGMNVKDFCLLKWSNIDGQILTYQRAKTEHNTKEAKFISVALKPETWEIINKWGHRSVNKEAYIFPHLKAEMSLERQRAIYQQLTKTINKYIKRIAVEVGIEKNITTYFARHSFATVLKRSGANIAMISELLGHSNLNVTQNYLDSFESEAIQKQTDVLLAGFNKKSV